ncbi:hypothetical protein EQG49_03645 [Periweissella cryptocerci]|uniref:Uncharacterized protein n=1 Tax=Periweissella cryptocerci TaxID=2506420 RepID=A0A4P6YSH4_9LACO|nr:hypothetical protein [Periweissella cryptocerci]QBO35616.1 hypothetical protein EQG49_03645 [Periweissella cryptocerci]
MAKALCMNCKKPINEFKDLNATKTLDKIYLCGPCMEEFNLSSDIVNQASAEEILLLINNPAEREAMLEAITRHTSNMETVEAGQSAYSAERIKAYRAHQDILVENENEINQYFLSQATTKTQYKTLKFKDSRWGALDTSQIDEALNIEAAFGWRVSAVSTNELGKNSGSVPLNLGSIGIQAGVNATVDVTLIILERQVPLELLK